MSEDLKQNWHLRADRCIDAWNLSKVVWTDHYGSSRIASCESKFGKSALKIGLYPDPIEAEIAVLKHLGPQISPQVYAYSIEDRAQLLPFISHDKSLISQCSDPEKEVEIWAGFYEAVRAKLRIPTGIPTLADFANVFERVLRTPLSRDVAFAMRRSWELRDVLMGPPETLRLLHGDMHHSNIICDTDGRWWLIDPHGVVGNPLYEIGAFMRNPMSSFFQPEGMRGRLERRVEILASRLRITHETVALYGFYGATFSIAWDIEDCQNADVDLVAFALACLEMAGR